MSKREPLPPPVSLCKSPTDPLSYAHFLHRVLHQKTPPMCITPDTNCAKLDVDNLLITILYCRRKECKMFREAEAIILNTCLQEGVSVDLVCSPLRTRTVARVRRLVVARLRKETNLSWVEIGMSLGRMGKSFRGAERPVPR